MDNRMDWQDELAIEYAAGQGQFHFGEFLRRRKWLILLVVLTGLGVGYLYFSRQEPVYEARAQVLVTKSRPRSPLSDVDRMDLYDALGQSLSTQVILIKSPLIVQRAVEDHQLGRLPSLAGSADPVQQIIGNLEVNPAGVQSDVLTLSYRSLHPEDCPLVVEAVVESYQLFLGETQQNLSQETVELITKAKDVLLAQLQVKESDYQQFRKEAPLLWKGDEGTNVHKQRLGTIENARAELQLTRSQRLAEIAAIQKAIERGGSREALLLMVTKKSGADQSHGPIEQKLSRQSMLAEQLFPLLLKEQMLLENLGRDHPKVAALQNQILFTRQHLRDLALEGGASAGGAQDFLAVYLDSLRQEAAAIEEREQNLNSLFEKEREAAKALSEFEITEETFRNDIARTQQLFEGVVKRLEEINLMKDHGGYSAQMISAPGLGYQVEPSLLKIVLVSAVISLFVGLGLGYLVEISDKTFRSPEDIRERLGMAVVGHIPHVRGKDAKVNGDSTLAPSLYAYHRSKSSLAEAFRGVRTSLYFSNRGAQHKVIQVTSPDPGDGKTTLSTNLAVSIAQSGKKVLLIDADLRRPWVHKVFNVSNKSGLCPIIKREVEPADAIQESGVENLWILPTGPRPPNPSELLNSPRFEELLAIFREQYDFVILDTPPLLAVTDPSAVAARVDGVLLTVRIHKNGSANVVRAAETLTSLDANVLGVVVNGIGHKKGYGYGNRSYQYGGYRYGSGYNGYGDYGTYYADDSAEQELWTPNRSPTNGQPAT